MGAICIAIWEAEIIVFALPLSAMYYVSFIIKHTLNF